MPQFSQRRASPFLATQSSDVHSQAPSGLKKSGLVVADGPEDGAGKDGTSVSTAVFDFL